MQQFRNGTEERNGTERSTVDTMSALMTICHFCVTINIQTFTE